MSYINLDKRSWINGFDNIQAITTEHGTNEKDVSIKFIVKNHNKEIEKVVPDEIGEAPVVFEEGMVEMESEACPTGARSCEYSDTLKGGLEVKNEDRDCALTAGFIAFDEDDSQKRILVSMDHGPGGISTNIWHPNNDTCDRSRMVGERIRGTPSENDVGRVVLNEGEVYSWDVGKTVDPLETIEYYWSLAGVEDETSNGTIPAENAGAITDHATNEAIGTASTSNVEDCVIYDDHSTKNGDSGCPFMERGKGVLISINYGAFDYNGKFRSSGPAAKETLEDASATFH